MGLLAQQINRRHFVKLPSTEKRLVGDRIVRILGGDPSPKVSGLPARRGWGDGGIDGRTQVLDVQNQETEAAFAVRIASKPFSRDELGAFILAMDREKLWAGIIVTAMGLAPDAQIEMGRKNREGKFVLLHLSIEDILEGNLPAEPLKFKDGGLSERLKESLRDFLLHREPTD